MTSPIEILITLPIKDELVTPLQRVSPRINLTVQPAKSAEEIPAEVWQRTEILYTSTILPHPGQAPSLRWIQFHWAGIDKLVDVPLLSEPDIKFTTLSGASASQMGEYILLALLALGHHLPELHALQAASSWPADRLHRLVPKELRKSTVGIVGYGSVGRQVARLLRPFGATVLATKRDAMHPADSGYIPEGLGDPTGDFVHRLYPAQALKSMLKDCDFVVIAVPLTQSTRSLISAAEFEAMRSGVYLVDISRGGVVDHDALQAAVASGKVAGAMLDVFPNEPLPANSPIWKLPNSILTPHISGISREYDARAMALFAENLNRYLGNLPLYNLFSAQKGY